MIRNPFFVLRYLSDVPYLLPYGQMVANHKRGFQINQTGVYLWKQLAREQSTDELFSSFFSDFDITENDKASIRNDLEAFLSELLRFGVLLDTPKQSSALSMTPPILSSNFIQRSTSSVKTPDPLSVNRFYQIAGIRLCISAPLCVYPTELEDFSCPESRSIDLNITIKDISQLLTDHKKTLPALTTPLLYTAELCVWEFNEGFLLSFPSFGEKFYIVLTTDGTNAVLYGDLTYQVNEERLKQFRENVFHALRHIFLFLAQKRGMVALHSASILYCGKAWLFSGPSGTGKSTHTNLWHDLLNVQHLNGDLNLLAFSDGVPIIYGIPWCGTSGRHTVRSYPLGGIVLLKQAPTDYVTLLSNDQKRLLVSQRLISPVWTQEQFDTNLSFTNQLADQILITRLFCTPKATAVTAIKKEIDCFLN